MSASSEAGALRHTGALFGRVSRNSEHVIVPINNSALAKDSAKPAFYCVHSASGVAGTDFLDLACRLEPAVRFYGLQAPPKHITDANFGSSVQQIAEHYANSVAAFQPTGPLVVGGYCLGAIIALEIAEKLRARGRTVGPLVVIDGVPENTGQPRRRWAARYWLDLARNLPGWIVHGDLMRSRTLRSLAWSLSNNFNAIAKRFMGLRRGEKLGGGYSIEGIMDLSLYPPAHRSFIDRLFNAFFTYAPITYSGNIIVYEATITPLLYLPRVGQTWREFAPQSEVVGIVGTHIGMMREPYVDALATDLRTRITEFFSSTCG
jgi:thioesterase domain-containing protein